MNFLRKKLRRRTSSPSEPPEPPKPIQQIKKYYLEGHTQKEAFDDLSKKFGYDVLSDSNTDFCFNNLSTNNYYPWYFDRYNSWFIAKWVFESYFDFKHAIYQGNCADYYMLPFNPRYAIKFKPNFFGNISQIECIDFYHGKDRPMKVVGKSLHYHKKNCFKFHSISHDILLLFQMDYFFKSWVENGNTLHTIFIAQLDFEKMKCRILHKQSVKYELRVYDRSSIFFNEKEKQKFGLQLRVENSIQPNIVIGQVEDNKCISFENVERNVDACCLMMQGKSIFGLKPIHDSNTGQLTMGLFETDFSTQNEESVRIRFDDEVSGILASGGGEFREPLIFTWFDNKCYINMWWTDKSSLVYVVDIDAQKSFRIEMNFPNSDKVWSNNVFGCQNDPNAVLLKTDKNVYQLSTKKSEKLINLCWFYIRRQAIFFNKEKFYKYSLKFLPSKLQPFSFE